MSEERMSDEEFKAGYIRHDNEGFAEANGVRAARIYNEAKRAREGEQKFQELYKGATDFIGELGQKYGGLQGEVDGLKEVNDTLSNTVKSENQVILNQRVKIETQKKQNEELQMHLNQYQNDARFKYNGINQG